MAERKPVRIAFVGDDWNFFAKLSGLRWKPSDAIFIVDLAEAERTPALFDLGEHNLVLVDWRINVQAGISPLRLLNLITSLTRRGLRVAVVVADDLYSTRLAIECMEAGVCSLTFMETVPLDLDAWLERVLTLPLRGPWVQKTVFP